MVFEMPCFTDGLAAFTFKVDRCGIKKNTRSRSVKRLAAIIEQPLLNYILRTPGSKWSSVFLVKKFLPQKAHGAIEVMQFQFFCAGDQVIPPPLATSRNRDKNRIRRGGAARSETVPFPR